MVFRLSSVPLQLTINGFSVTKEKMVLVDERETNRGRSSASSEIAM
jgi:hypothetical protein